MMQFEATARVPSRDQGLLRASSAIVGALWEMTKPRVTRLVVATTALGAVMAKGSVELVPLLLTIAGTTLLVAGANALNMFLEEESDALMTRTRTRPLPTGRLTRETALAFGVALAAFGTVVLANVNPLACELGVMAFISYVLVYTPLKPVTQAALYLGAVPGAMPPLIGYAGQHAALTAAAWSTFALLLVWQLPHFLAIAVFRREEYERAAIAVMPVVASLAATSRAIGAWSVVLLLVSFSPCVVGLAGEGYALVAAVSGSLFCAYALFGRREQAIESWARKLFFASMPHLLLLFVALAFAAV
jgi:protoheme IX farnesyltransferase